MTYANRRRAIYDPIRAQGIFSWDFLYGQEYALASPGQVSQTDCTEIAYATEQLGSIFAKTISIVQAGHRNFLRELGIPAGAFDAVKVVFMPEIPTVIGRFDFVKTVGGWKMLEFNADTPGGIVEAYHVNSEVCRAFGASNPNEGRETDIIEAFDKAFTVFAERGYPVEQVVFSALEWHAEDFGTVQYLLRRSGRTARFVPLKDLRVHRDRLCASVHGDLIPVDVWFRLHPLAVLCGETDADGYPTGTHVLDLIARKKLAVLNPPSALIAQTKALQALIWNLCEAREFFNSAEQEIIRSYMLPTYLENRFDGVCAYVTKPVLGREGGGVTIYGNDGRILCQSSDRAYREQLLVFQKYVEMEEVEVETLNGRRRGFAVWGSFLIGGKPSAVNVRIGGRITDDMSYFWPIILADDVKKKEGCHNGRAMG